MYNYYNNDPYRYVTVNDSSGFTDAGILSNNLVISLITFELYQGIKQE